MARGSTSRCIATMIRRPQSWIGCHPSLKTTQAVGLRAGETFADRPTTLRFSPGFRRRCDLSPFYFRLALPSADFAARGGQMTSPPPQPCRAARSSTAAATKRRRTDCVCTGGSRTPRQISCCTCSVMLPGGRCSFCSTPIGPLNQGKISLSSSAAHCHHGARQPATPPTAMVAQRARSPSHITSFRSATRTCARSHHIHGAFECLKRTFVAAVDGNLGAGSFQESRT